jgi:hypothetical protein
MVDQLHRHSPTNQVQWAEFREAFQAQHILAGVMTSKHREFMDLQQGDQLVYAYSKMFNHLVQYAPEQIDTDEKKKYHFMNDLSTKLQECLALNANWTFLELVSNAIIADDAIRAQQESKQEEGFGSPIRECSSQVPDGLCSTLPSTSTALSSVCYLSTAASGHCA